MRRHAAVLALALVLAGCGAIAGGPAESTPRETVTPAPVPTDATDTTADSTLPPGVGGGGDIDAETLARAHLDAIDGRSYVRRVSRSFDNRTGNATLRVESATRYRYERPNAGGIANASGYADGTWLYTRYVQFSARFSYGEVEDVRSRHGSSAARSIRRHLALSNATVAETLVDGDLHYLVTAERDRYEAIGSTTDYRVRAVVTPDGLVRSLSVSYTNEHEGDPVAVTYSHRYEFEPVTVERPDWVDREFGDVGGSNRTG